MHLSFTLVTEVIYGSSFVFDLHVIVHCFFNFISFLTVYFLHFGLVDVYKVNSVMIYDS